MTAQRLRHQHERPEPSTDLVAIYELVGSRYQRVGNSVSPEQPPWN
ncbi:hypothetical protein [Nocardia carnea]|nr:hypothetical protein [Nocardia carnea]